MANHTPSRTIAFPAACTAPVLWLHGSTNLRKESRDIDRLVAIEGASSGCLGLSRGLDCGPVVSLW